MDLFKAIEKRHSYRGPYKRAVVPRKDLEKIVDAAIRAPSGYNEQTTSFVIVDDTEKITKIAEIAGQPRIHDAQAIIVVCMDLSARERREFFFGIEDYASACENLLLAATALGYGTVWIDGALRRDDRARKIGDALSVPENFEVRVIVPVGVPDETWQQKDKQPFSSRAFFNTFGEV